VRNITSAAEKRSEKLSLLSRKSHSSSSESDESLFQNELGRIYANDMFVGLRKDYEQQLVRDAMLQVERKHLISEMDDTLESLKKWRQDRARQQPVPQATSDLLS
jgi:hypothetical protein